MGRILLEEYLAKHKSAPQAAPSRRPPVGFDPHALRDDSDRTLYFSGPVDELSITQAISHLTTLSRQDLREPIQVVFNTYGGSVDDMFALYDMIEFLETPIHTIGLGKIMSAGVLLLACGVKGERKLGKHARIMIHPISSGAMGTVFDQKKAVEEMDRLQEQWQRCILEHTKFTAEELDQLMKSNVDTYLTAAEAVKYGIVDKIL